jgi:hypothetical protein
VSSSLHPFWLQSRSPSAFASILYTSSATCIKSGDPCLATASFIPRSQALRASANHPPEESLGHSGSLEIFGTSSFSNQLRSGELTLFYFPTLPLIFSLCSEGPPYLHPCARKSNTCSFHRQELESRKPAASTPGKVPLYSAQMRSHTTSRGRNAVILLLGLLFRTNCIKFAGNTRYHACPDRLSVSTSSVRENSLLNVFQESPAAFVRAGSPFSGASHSCTSLRCRASPVMIFRVRFCLQ